MVMMMMGWCWHCAARGASCVSWLAIALAVAMMTSTAAPTMASTAASTASAAASAAAATDAELKPDAWTDINMQAGETRLFTLHNPSPGAECTGPCDHGNRWVKVSAHSQALQVRLTMSVQGAPLTPQGTCTNTTGCATATSTGAALISRLGQWYGTLEPECYFEGAYWAPFPSNPDIHVAVTLLPVSTASIKAAGVAVIAEFGSGRMPMPGGCATTSPFPFDAMIDLQYSRDKTTVDYQQADFGSPLAANFPSSGSADACTCDYISAQADSNPGTLKFELYRTYLSNCGSDFHKPLDPKDLLVALSKMSTVKHVKTFGIRVDEGSILPDKPRRKALGSVPGQGVIYNVLVTDTYRAALYPNEPIESFQSVYAPAHTYACSLTNDPNFDNCHHLIDGVYMAVCMCAGAVGIFLALFGLRFYIASMMIFAGVATATATYIVLATLAPSLSFAASMGASLGTAAVLVFPLLMCWKCTNWNGMWITFQGAVAGFLVACLVFATPLGEQPLFRNDFNYGMTFACVCLLVPVLLLVKPAPICVFSTSMVGCYMLL
ncbi:hypothetical protein PTSG_09344 [Salpingoeca rosetta]|uniref:DUF4203 domain-containing protein n=1 Tax=Salpingoeca rosetta (strain ATCC 50818 / BSB-021) TaxID=946362 RepID=F2UMD1_SALR5|nr:uncharacterized protein PTSG_09344 [Salpingoeca rosetta]EGD78280.1 hypothetical protein PTSG_09344 [Salpingoeca rosetta]|eukprot:XP_004989603.1 hypothetical protein PTSG_09344 [Salpingoeca rosetta]